MKELEDEIDVPTGITTIQPPPLLMNGVLLSRECALMLQFTHGIGLKYVVYTYVLIVVSHAACYSQVKESL